jgi:hypothetical protein
MIMFVLDDPQKLDGVLQSWREAGIHGVTIIESTGYHRRKKQHSSLHMRYSFLPLDTGGEEGNYTLVALVRDEGLIARCLEHTEKITGTLDQSSTGVFSAWPLSMVKGASFTEDGA